MHCTLCNVHGGGDTNRGQGVIMGAQRDARVAGMQIEGCATNKVQGLLGVWEGEKGGSEMPLQQACRLEGVPGPGQYVRSRLLG